MKKVLLIILCLTVISLSFIACSAVDDTMKHELCGTWKGEYSLATVTINFRADGTFYMENRNVLGRTDKGGTYTIKKDKIILVDSKGDEEEIEYSYNKKLGKLYLTRTGVSYEKQ